MSRQSQSNALAPSITSSPPVNPTPPAAPSVPPRHPNDESDEGRYVFCGVCRAELLKTDNYCYHCGVLMRADAASTLVTHRDIRKPNGFIFLLSIILTAMLVFFQRFAPLDSIIPGTAIYVIPSLSLFGILCLVVAFFRNRNFMNQFLTVILAALWLAANIYAFV